MISRYSHIPHNVYTDYLTSSNAFAMIERYGGLIMSTEAEEYNDNRVMDSKETFKNDVAVAHLQGRHHGL